MTITQLPSTTEPHSVSYSESSSYLLCQRKHYYGYTKRLQRVNESQSLKMGSAGHKILQAFYETILEAGDVKKEQLAAFDDALSKAHEMYDQLLKEGYEDDPKKATLWEVVFDFYFPNEPFVKNGWQILAVEKEFRLDTVTNDGETIATPFVIDMIAFDPDGKMVVIDHKFIYDFYTYDDASLQPQLPLYFGGLQALGYKPHYGLYNMLRNRKIVGTKLKKDELIEAITEAGGEIEPKAIVKDLEAQATALGITVATGATVEQRKAWLDIRPSVTRVQRTFLEQLDTAQEIVAMRERTPEELDLKMHRVANKMVCKSCSFRDLCSTELMGGNTALMLRTEYKVREKRAKIEESEEVEDDDE